MNNKLPGTGQAIEELKRISRILEIIQMIAVFPRRYRRKDFARRYEISERMVTKDLQVIRHGLRLPLRSSPQGYYFDSLPNLPAVQFPLRLRLVSYLKREYDIIKLPKARLP